ncbi:MAG: hypothetical protein ABSF90_18575 [Syntrophobacteraceae bacterium]
MKTEIHIRHPDRPNRGASHSWTMCCKWLHKSFVYEIVEAANCAECRENWKKRKTRASGR